MSPVRPTLQVVGRRMDAEHYRLRDFLTRTAQPYEWHEVDSPEADLLLASLGRALESARSSDGDTELGQAGESERSDHRAFSHSLRRARRGLELVLHRRGCVRFRPTVGVSERYEQ